MVAMAPVPPVRLVRTIALPRCGSTSGVMARDTTSMAPPAPHMMEPARSRVGNCCAVANDTLASIDMAAATASFVFCISILESPLMAVGAMEPAEAKRLGCRTRPGPLGADRCIAGPNVNRPIDAPRHVFDCLCKHGVGAG
jgi:hypothetical protein